MSAFSGLMAHNTDRSATAAANTCERVAWALAVLGDDALPSLAEAGRLRLAHPPLSLPQLAAIACVNKDTLNERLRRLIRRAERVHAGQPVYGWGGRRPGAGTKKGTRFPNRRKATVEPRGPVLSDAEVARLRRLVGAS